ncbi:hypothetical protein FLO80_09775 [Aquicoccus porphyridii]|uniref:Uncharacterized protein n=1 Tax=Aquicoccus porphyridii TaxID=1852029 RepID=A0A5A9ZGB0_9RHOB|nr:hypothetical protein [Aquicoccus porphyridii]KAA0916015.1 hypothetical protein FLO80_09775 [Aquicoccus porphyridii]
MSWIVSLPHAIALLQVLENMTQAFPPTQAIAEVGCDHKGDPDIGGEPVAINPAMLNIPSATTDISSCRAISASISMVEPMSRTGCPPERKSPQGSPFSKSEAGRIMLDNRDLRGVF